MPECTNSELKSAREALKLPRWKLAAAVNVSESTLERWETGESQPHPDEVDKLADALNDPALWHRWMLSNYDSYRRRYIASTNLQLPVSVMRVGQQLKDVLKLQDQLERDAIDGSIDDLHLKERYTREVKAAMAALGDSLHQLL